MAAIRIIHDEVQKVFKDLRNKVEQLETIPANISVTTSQLDVVTQIEEIEETYYKAIAEYKTILLQCEQSIYSKVEEFIQREEELSRNMK